MDKQKKESRKNIAITPNNTGGDFSNGIKTETVKLNYLRIAPRKARLVANLIKNLSVNEAQAQLMINPNRVSEPILKLLNSAVANAVNNKKMKADHLVINNIMVNQGPTLKRFMPRAMGRATPIMKRTSHIVITIKEVDKKCNSRFNIITKKVKPSKKVEKAKAKAVKEAKEKKLAEKDAINKNQEKPGFIKKMFRRKSI